MPNEPMTPEHRAEIKALWKEIDQQRLCVLCRVNTEDCDCDGEAYESLIDIPGLCDEVKELQARIAQLERLAELLKLAYLCELHDEDYPDKAVEMFMAVSRAWPDMPVTSYLVQNTIRELFAADAARVAEREKADDTKTR